MEAIMFHSSPDHQPISPYKSHIKNAVPKRGTNRPPFISRQTSENFAPMLNLQNTTGPFQLHPPQPYHHLSHSYPPFSFQRQQQPPLLPLPISTTIAKPNNTTNITNLARARGLSCPPTNRKPNNNTSTSRVKARDTSLTPKKSKTIAKKEENMKPLGPDPKDLPKNVQKISTLLSGNSNATNDVSSYDAIKVQVGEFSGSVAFSTISPPPSSLPLPTFSLRPKLSCKAEAAGVDAGATDNLRRLLRLP